MAGTVPTKGTAKRARNSASASVEAVLHATTTRSGAVFGDGVAEHVDDARDQRGFCEVAVGKARVVREIDKAGIRPGRLHLAEYREAAEAGIEDKNGRSLRHAVWANSGRSEHPPEDGVDVLKVMVEVEVSLELLVRKLCTNVLICLEQ